MKLRFGESTIADWATQYRITRKEPELLALRPTVRRGGFLTKAQLAQLARWKSPRSAPRVARNSDAYVREITGFALGARDERARIESLTLLDGVQCPTASVVLHLFHEEPYPLLDYRAVWSVQASQPKHYTFPFWLEYVQFCRSVAEKASVDMRTLDRALWQFSKANQPSAKA